MSNIIIITISIAITIILLCAYFSKENVKNSETKIYSTLLCVNLAFNITAALTFLMASIPKLNPCVGIFQKLYMIEMLFMIILMYTYNAQIIDFDDKTKLKVSKISTYMAIIISILILASPITVIIDNGLIDNTGMAYNIMLISTIIYFILTLIYSIRLFIRNKNELNKNIPFIILLILYVIGIVLRSYTPEIWFENIFFSLTFLIMYFTIENPDVKMLNKLEIAKDKAEQANAAKTDFLSSMSHEIRTPLNAIVGFSEAIGDASTLEEAQENAKDIVTASNTLLELVNGILNISKIEANKMEIVNTEYDLTQECDDLVKLIKPRIGEKPIELRYYVAPDIPSVLYGDKGKIKEIITNIMVNAVKYTEEGYIDLRVTCINKGNNSALVISVEDSGRGIKPENISKLFNKFERNEEDKNTTIEGAGLGLAITKKLVEMMGGKIIVQSVYGSGSKFTIYIQQKIVNKPSLTPKLKQMDDNLSFEGKRILVVDDNILNVKVVETILKKLKPTIEFCESGPECVEKVKNGEQYDLILLDDMMPKVTGTETLQSLREIPEFKTKVVVLTANAITGSKEKYIEIGFDDYLSKPIEKPELQRVLKKFLNNDYEESSAFDPIPEELYNISDTIVERINNEETTKE